MNFLLDENINYLYFSFGISLLLLIAISVILFSVIRNILNKTSYNFSMVFAVSLIVCFIFFSFSTYSSLGMINDYNESSKGKIEQYYNVEKVGKKLVFSQKKNNKTLKKDFSAVIEEEN